MSLLNFVHCISRKFLPHNIHNAKDCNSYSLNHLISRANTQKTLWMEYKLKYRQMFTAKESKHEKIIILHMVEVVFLLLCVSLFFCAGFTVLESRLLSFSLSLSSKANNENSTRMQITKVVLKSMQPKHTNDEIGKLAQVDEILLAVCSLFVHQLQ